MGSGPTEVSHKFQHIQGKQNVVADAISRLRTLGLYRDSDNEVELSAVDNIVQNIVKEINSTDSALKKPTYNVGKLNMEILKKEQQWDKFCKGKVRDLENKPDPTFLLDHNSILRKVTKLKYTMEPAIVVPGQLASIISIEFHNAKGHQSISRMVNMI